MTRPNILLITSDQQHWNTLGCRNPALRTPALDRLAAEGTLFERAYCPNPTCTPTRASLITGLYPCQHGAYTLGTGLPTSVPTIGDAFQRAGYATGLIGKAHFQPLASSPEHPSLEAYPVLQDQAFWRGFNGPFFGFQRAELARNHGDEAHVGQHYALWLEERCPDWRRHFRAPTGTGAPQHGRWSLPAELHLNTWIAERSCALLDAYARAEQPFLLWSSFFDPHPPYLVPAPWDAAYDPAAIAVPRLSPGEHAGNPPLHRLTQEREPDFAPWRISGHHTHGLHSHLRDPRRLAEDVALYYGMISFMDQAIGRILDHLDRLGLGRDTLVLFTTDHGHLFGHHGLTAKGPFHYEDLLRVPFLVRQPGMVPAGRRSAALQSLVDVAPTVAAWCGVAAHPMAGVDQGAVWRGEAAAARDHALVENRHEPETINLLTYVDERWKITVQHGSAAGELYDLAEDPGEVRNRWDDPACAGERERLLRRLIDAEMTKHPLPMPRLASA